MNFDSCLEISSISLINSSTVFLSIKFNLSQILNKLLTSPIGPFEIYKNLVYCLFDCNSNPSAIFKAIDKDAL